MNLDILSIDLVAFLAFLKRRITVIVLVSALCLAGTFFYYFNAPRIYKAHARLVYNPELPQVSSDIENYLVGFTRFRSFSTHIDMISTDSVIQRASLSMGRRLLASDLRYGLTALSDEEIGRNNNIIEIFFTDPDPRLARDAANAICDAYVNHVSNHFSKTGNQQLSAVEKQVQELKRGLKKAEKDLRNFREENRIVGLENQTTVLLNTIALIESRLERTKLSLVKEIKKLAELELRLSKDITHQESAFRINHIAESRLVSLEFEMLELESQYSENHPKYKRLSKKISSLKKSIASDIKNQFSKRNNIVQRDRIQNRLIKDFLETSASVAVLKTRKGALERFAQKHYSSRLSLLSIQQNHEAINREISVKEETLSKLQNQHQEMKIAFSTPRNDIRIFELADLPEEVIKDVSLEVFYLAILIGIALGLAAALILDRFNRTIKNARMIEDTLNLDLLGFIPRLSSSDLQFTESRIDNPAAIHESFRAVRSHLRNRCLGKKSVAFLVTSAIEGEGKSTVATNLAISFAMDGKKTVIVDTDIYRSRLSKLFNMRKNSGLIQYLTGKAAMEDILNPTPVPGLFVISSGGRLEQNADLLGSGRFRALINELRNVADIIIVDSAPVMRKPDSAIICRQVDAAILVTRWLKTPLRGALFAKGLLKRMGCKVCGAIFNDVAGSEVYYQHYFGMIRIGGKKYEYEYDYSAEETESQTPPKLIVPASARPHPKSKQGPNRN